jgi:hypothetical protein
MKLCRALLWSGATSLDSSVLLGVWLFDRPKGHASTRESPSLQFPFNRPHPHQPLKTFSHHGVVLDAATVMLVSVATAPTVDKPATQALTVTRTGLWRGIGVTLTLRPQLTQMRECCHLLVGVVTNVLVYCWVLLISNFS